MSKLLLPLLLLLSLSTIGCTAPDKATEVLKGAGYTNIEITGFSPFACSKDDMFATGFKAKGPTGVAIKGTVCSAWFKGATIRLD